MLDRLISAEISGGHVELLTGCDLLEHTRDITENEPGELRSRVSQSEQPICEIPHTRRLSYLSVDSFLLGRKINSDSKGSTSRQRQIWPIIAAGHVSRWSVARSKLRVTDAVAVEILDWAL